MRNQIRRNRVHSNHHQRERPLPVALLFNQPRKCRQRQKADSSAEQNPARSPYPFHDGANSRHMQQQSSRNSCTSRQEQLLKRNLRRLRPQPPPRNQSENHRSERRDKTQRQITTLV